MNPIIDKIRKLLRLSRDSKATPNEAATAMAKAMKLASDHGIDLSALPSDDPGRGGMSHVTEPSQCGPAHRMASGIVKRHFGVATLFDSTGSRAVIHFIGIETNCQIASYCYIYLVRSMRQAWRKRENRRLRDRQSFLRGYASAINSLMPGVFHQNGIILCADNYIEAVIFAGRHGIKIRTTKPSAAKISDASFHHGFVAGQKGGIHNAIRGTDYNLIS